MPTFADQLLSPDSLRATGYFDPKGVAHQRALQTWLPPITPRRFIYDLGLTCVISTQLWHHIYCGGGLCDLPPWEPPAWDTAPAPEVVASGVEDA